MFRIPPTMDDGARARCDALIRMMENACSEMLLAPNWALNMQIVDELNREQDSVVLSEVIRILRKRLGSQDVRVLSVSLTLAETLVKNCGAPVHREVASERFMAAMAKIARTHSFKTRRESLSIADQTLDIIQAWGEAFLPKRREFPLFVETYHNLRAEGLPFKQQYQSDRPPVLDPGAGSLLDRPESRSGRGGGGATGERGGKRGSGTPEKAGGADPDEFAVLSVSNREIVATGASCSEMLEQVLQAADSRAEVRNSDIAIELVEQLKATGPKIVRIIEANGDGDPAMLGALFKVNDAVDNVLRLYKDIVDGVKSVPLLPPSRHSSGVDAVSKDMEKLAVGESADSSSKPGSVPMLSRPPSDRKGRRGKEKGQTQDSNGLGTPDLLSGFELEGASNASVNASNRALLGGGGASATASSGGNFFAGFATPAGNAATPTGGGGAGMVAAKGIVGSQAGAIVAGGQVTGQQTTPPLPQQQQQQQQYPPQPALAGPKTSADKAQSLIDNLGALYAGGSSSRQIGLERMGPAETLSTRTFPTGGGKAAWAGSAGPGGSQGMTTVAGGGAVTVSSGAGQASPFDALGAQAPQPKPQPQPQPFQQVGQEAHGQAGHIDQSFVGQDPFQGQAQDPFQCQPSQDQQQPTQPIQGYQQPQDFQQQPQGFQQPPQAFQQQQSQGFQQQPDVFQSPQGFQYQQPDAFQPLPQGFQQQQPQGFQQQQPQGFQQQQPQSYQQQPQGFQQQPQDFQQQQSFYGQQPQGFQQPYQQQF